MVESLVALALFSVVFMGTLVAFTASWRSQTKSYVDYKLQSTAQMTMDRIVRGDRMHSVGGLLGASAMLVQTTSPPLLAYRITWTETPSMGSPINHDDQVTYYHEDGKLYRLVTPWSGSLVPVWTGGTEVADGVSEFSPVAVASIQVEITIVLSDLRGSEFTLQTAVTPRNMITD